MKQVFIQAMYNTEEVSRLVDLLWLAVQNLSLQEFGDVLQVYKIRIECQNPAFCNNITGGNNNGKH